MPVHTTVDPVEATVKAVDALLTALETTPTIGAGIAYLAAIARHGRNLVATAGDAALDTAFARIKAEAPDAAAGRERERIVREIWEGPQPEERRT